MQSTCYVNKPDRPNLYYDNNFVPSYYLFKFNLTEYEAYHQIGKILAFHMAYNLYNKQPRIGDLKEFPHNCCMQLLMFYAKIDVT